MLDRYTQSALDREIQAVASASQGACSDALWYAARNLGQHVAAGTIEESQVIDELVKASEKNGHIQRDGLARIKGTIASGIRAGMARPRQRQEYRPGKQSSSYSPTSPISAPRREQARKTVLPSQKWRARALAFFTSLNALPHAEREQARQALLARGLDPHLAYLQFGIRWLWQDRVEPLADWDQESYTSAGGKTVTRQYIPKGLVIAAMLAGDVIGIEVRRADASQAAQYGKYKAMRGNASPLAFCLGLNGLPVLICESALDAALLYQETAGQYQCIASMGAGKHLPLYVKTIILQQAPAIYYVPDADQGGEKGKERIRQAFPQAKILTLPQGIKDPGELVKAGGLPTVKGWLQEVGLIR